MKSLLICVVLLGAFLSTPCIASNWQQYYSDSDSTAAFTDVNIIDENILEVLHVYRIGGACVYSRYKIDCSSSKWFQDETAFLPCNMEYSMQQGEKRWRTLNEADVHKPMMKKLIKTVCVNESRSDTIKTSAGHPQRKALAEKLTTEYRMKKWDGLLFEAYGKEGKIIKITHPKVKKQTKLNDGEITSMIGTILTPDIINRLKKFGFVEVQFIDGMGRPYPVELSRKYYDEMQIFYREISGGR